MFVTDFFYSMFIAASPMVNITNGTLEGSTWMSGNGREFSAFQGIPYALPPVGELRFELPQPSKAWNGTLSVKKDGNMCVQEGLLVFTEGIVGSEDCLYLNVYTPRVPTTGSENKLPVMVWFHGGAFSVGSGDSQYYNPKYFLNHDIVFVGINYRLGPLGFLSTEDLISPGNLAMKDQVQALRWVKENIAAFGGDANSVTIVGESAGAASVHFHLISPLSKGLFHRGISQSGSAINPWAITRPGRPKELAIRLAQLLNCPAENSMNILTCLRTKSAEDIARTSIKFREFGMDPLISFSPVIEPQHPGAFLSKEPYELLSTGVMNDVPWLTGFNSHEGALRLILMDALEETNAIQELNSRWQELAPMSLAFEHNCPKKNHAELATKIKQFYLGDKNISESTRFELIDLYSDVWFYNGLREALKVQTKNLKSPVYQYRFAYKGRYSTSAIASLWKDYGVAHGDDLFYFFPFALFFNMINLPISPEHENLINIMTTMWYNFAKTGNPTPEITEKIPVKWMPVRTDALEYLNIGSPTNLTMMTNENLKNLEFWESMPACVKGNIRENKR